MKIKQLALTLILTALVPAMASAGPIPRYSAANIFTANSTVNLISTYTGSGHLDGIKCIFPSNALGASVKVLFTIDSQSSNFIIDPTTLEREESLDGQFTSGWLPFNLSFSSSLQVQLNNTSLGTADIHCWATWDTP
jgi:hypothetical protein